MVCTRFLRSFGGEAPYKSTERAEGVGTGGTEYGRGGS